MIKAALLAFLLHAPAWAAVEMFKIQVSDRGVRVEAPPKASAQYAVAVENQSLSDLVGKFTANGRDLKFVAVKPNESRTVEFRQEGGVPVAFRLLAPAFQEVVLVFGKGPYEIPPRQ